MFLADPMVVDSDMHTLETSIMRSLCDQIFMSPIHWTLATGFPETATHIIDFGPGGLNGIGPLTAHNLEGHGVHVVTLGDTVCIPSTEKAAEIIDSDGLRKAGIRLPVPNPSPVITSASRYASKGAEELCLVTEVYSLLLDHLHRFVPTSHFQSLLEQHLQGGCSSEIGKLRLMAGRIFGLDLSYFDLSFMKQDTIPEIQKMLGSGTAGGRSSLSKFPCILFTNQEMDPTMSTVFGNWEPLAKLIFILSPDTSFTKAGVGAKSWLPYAAMFTAYKQLWVTLWDQPRICAIRKKIDTHVWQSSSTSNVTMSNAKGEDFTSDLMCLAIANAGQKESNDFPGPTTTNDNPVNDIPGSVAPITPTITPSAPVVVPSTPVVIPSAPAILVLAPANTTTALNSATLLPAIPAPGPPMVSAGAAAATAASEVPGPPATTVDSEVPVVPNDVLVVAAAPSSGHRG
ncbi:uncharacterized protein EDB91DRAFT_1250033 [Suillus paluster]|uniref:uncharacterized protein n=1 Tax=Suillus paluster TaxID=48578 RepID=UPI001B86E7C2|nr:uncharacterized protein EDB91DRAFT_1250033 [Suillus paluster]KAG1736410.1 hypothetical protein EDB91DRAFT_1250033 [Suillus paluster]